MFKRSSVYSEVCVGEGGCEGGDEVHGGVGVGEAALLHHVGVDRSLVDVPVDGGGGQGAGQRAVDLDPVSRPGRGRGARDPRSGRDGCNRSYYYI